MARARTIKPGFFENEVLAELPFVARLLFAGLWTLADREGRLEDRPKRIIGKLFPYDDDLDGESMIADLAARGFLDRYDVAGEQYIQIVSFAAHQHPHPRESASAIPAREEDTFSNEQAAPFPGEGAPSKEEDAPRHVQGITKELPRRAGSSHVPTTLPPGSSHVPTTLPPGSSRPPLPPAGGMAVEAPELQEPPETPYAMWAAFCTAAEYDIGAATAQEKGRSLKAAQRLIAGEVTTAEVADCTRYLRSQHWRTAVLSLSVVEGEIGKWRMAGKPAVEKARASPGNGKPPPITSEAEALRRKYGGEPRPREPDAIDAEWRTT